MMQMQLENNSAELAELDDILKNLACGIMSVRDIMPDKILNYFRRMYDAVVNKKVLPPERHQKNIEKAVHYINNLLDHQEILESVYKIAVPLIKQGQIEGEIPCPKCGNKAYYKAETNSDKIEYAYCQNQCFNTK